MSGDESLVEGPLHGYHHETYAFPPLGEASRAAPGRWKCRERRSDVLWFDRRCFVSEEQLLRALAGRITGIPEVVDVGGIVLARFIEGRTLGSLHKSGRPVPDVLCRQITGLFRQLVAVTGPSIPVERRCERADCPDDGDSDGFLQRLIAFTELQVYRRSLDRFGCLFWHLGLSDDSFRHLRKHVSGLSARPFCLLHADLHRENFVVDAEQRLWTIDWELAMVGDPLYDLATHLHLMRYPAWQARHMAQEWSTAVERERPGGSRAWQYDLEPLLDFKRAQSVFTDVIRTALGLNPASGPWQLTCAAVRLRRILAAAARPLGLEPVPAPRTIAAALLRWHVTQTQEAG